jgi:hypothetical protein
MDRTIGELPGLAGVEITTMARRDAIRRMGAAATADAHLTTPLAAFRA